MIAPDRQDDADTRYVPPPGAHPNSYDPQLNWLQRRLAADEADRPPASPRWPRYEQPIDDEGDDWDEELEEEEEAGEPAAARRPRAPTDTSLIPRAWIVFAMVWTVRLLMLGMLVASFIGSIASFNPRGIGPMLAAFPWLHSAPLRFVSGAQRSAELIGAVLQLWITGVEYWKAPPKLSLRELFHKRY